MYVYTRGRQHITDDENSVDDESIGVSPCYRCDDVGEVSSCMKDHSDKKHDGQEDDETDYKFTVITSHKQDLTRQSEKAIRFKQAWRKFCLLTTNYIQNLWCLLTGRVNFLRHRTLEPTLLTVS